MSPPSSLFFRTASVSLVFFASVVVRQVASTDSDQSPPPTTVPGPPESSQAAPTSFEKQVQSLRTTTAWQNLELRQGIEDTFSPVIGELHLPPALEPKLITLIAERRGAWRERHQQLADSGRAAARAGHPEQAPGIAEYQAAQAVIENRVDAEIRQLVGAEKFPQVSATIAALSEISLVRFNDGKRMAEANCPLTVEQHLKLALALHAVRDPQANPEAKHPSTLPLNQRGLTSLDEQLLSQLHGVLSPRQLVVLARGCYVANRRTRSLPVEWECDCELPANARVTIGNRLAAKGRYESVAVTMNGCGRAKLRRGPVVDSTASPDRDYCAVFCEAFPGHFLMMWYCVALFDDAGNLVDVVNENQVEWLRGKPHAKSPFAAQ